ncbi:MAG: restriction endonuclease subunit S [Treponema sp.]|nr:restriction endonuclease subunit S [Treponema sp.]
MGKNKNTVVELVETTTEIEAPYELPEGWKWCRLGDFINIFRGVSYKKGDAHTEKLKNDCLIMRGGNIIEGNIDLESDNIYVDKSLVSENQYIKKYDVIIVTSTGSSKVIGRAGISYSDYSDVAFGAFLTLARPNDFAYKPYINQYFQSSLYRERIRELASGVNINNIRTDYITDSPIPLPPTLEEQQRIVNRIETLFAKLDQAKEKAQNVVDTFETRKASILHKAFTGELTKKWREENGVGEDSWEIVRFDDCISKMQNGLSKRSGETGIDSVVLRLANLGEEDFDLSDLRLIKLDEKEIENYTLRKDDVVMIRVNGSKSNVGRLLLVKESKNWSFCDHIIRIKFNNDCLASYMVYFSKTKHYQDYILENMVSSAGQNTISRKGLAKLSLQKPSLQEQQKIVHILDNIFEKEAKAKEAAEAVLEQIDLLKKSILARAFRGEL